MEFIGLKSKKDLSWFQDERLTTEFQAKYYDRLTSFRSNIKSEEDRLLKQTLMRVKSIKIKDYYKGDFDTNNNNNNNNNNKENVRTRTSPRRTYDSEDLRIDVNDLQEKLDKERLIILKKFQRNSIENAKKMTYVNQSLIKPTPRSKSNMQTVSDDKIKLSARNKHQLDFSRPKTVSKPLLFHDSVDGYKIDIKNTVQNIDNTEIKVIDFNRRMLNSRTGTLMYSGKDPDNLTYTSINFPRINHPTYSVETPTSSRREKSSKPIKQQLKPKSAKLLFYDQNDQISSTNWYMNNYNKWVVDKSTNNKISDANNKLLSYYEHKKALTSSQPEPPSTTPTSQFYNDNESRPKTNMTKRTGGTSRTRSTSLLRKLRKSPHPNMHIKDLMKYMKPSDTQSLESKSNENLAYNLTTDAVLEFNEERNMFVKSNERFNYESTASGTNNDLILSKMNISSVDMKPEKFEINIKIPLDNEVY